MPIEGGEAAPGHPTEQRESHPPVPARTAICVFATERGGRSKGSRVVRLAGAAGEVATVVETEEPIAGLGDRRGTAGGSRTWSASSPTRRRGRREFNLFVQSLARRRRPGPGDAASRRARAEPGVLSGPLAGDDEGADADRDRGPGPISRLARCSRAGDRGAGRGAGPDSLRGAQPPRSLDDGRAAQRQARLSPRGRLGRRGRGRGGRARGGQVEAGRPGDDQPGHLLRPMRRPAWKAKSRSAPTSPSWASTWRARPPSWWWSPPPIWAGCRTGCPGREAAGFTLATLTAWRMLTDRAQAPGGRDGADLGRRRRRRHGGAPDRGAPRRPSHRHQRLRRQARRPRSGSAPRSTVNHRTGRRGRARCGSETGGRGADVVVDCVGEATWTNSLRALRRGRPAGGLRRHDRARRRRSICGGCSGISGAFWARPWGTAGSSPRSCGWRRRASSGRWWTAWCRSRTAPRPIERMQRGEQTGKLVIEVSP